MLYSFSRKIVGSNPNLHDFSTSCIITTLIINFKFCIFHLPSSVIAPADIRSWVVSVSARGSRTARNIHFHETAVVLINLYIYIFFCCYFVEKAVVRHRLRTTYPFNPTTERCLRMWSQRCNSKNVKSKLDMFKISTRGSGHTGASDASDFHIAGSIMLILFIFSAQVKQDII